MQLPTDPGPFGGNCLACAFLLVTLQLQVVGGEDALAVLPEADGDTRGPRGADEEGGESDVTGVDGAAAAVTEDETHQEGQNPCRAEPHLAARCVAAEGVQRDEQDHHQGSRVVVEARC